MRTVLDFNEDGAPEPWLLPDGSLCLDGDDVVLQLREVEVRMSTPQLVALAEAINHWLFRDMGGEKDLNDEDHCDAEEHQRLRKIFRAMLDDQALGKVPISDAFRWELQAALARNKIDADHWRSQAETILDLQNEVTSLRAQLGKKRTRRKAAGP